MKRLSKEAILYLVFGILTTMIDYVAALGLYRLTEKSILSNTLAWTIAVLFAFVTNKRYVFCSQCESVQKAGKEFADFLVSRLLTLGLSDVLISAGIELSIPFAVSKIISSVVSIVGNYILSKLFVFSKKHTDKA